MHKYIFVLVFITLFFFGNTHSIRCQRDTAIFQSEQDQHNVDWWLIFKMPHYSDLYLYYDSDMTEPLFKTGKYHLSSRSSFGKVVPLL
ncbi:hypothetical protein SAMD00019534_027610 [Acytostelium subglobosum LB1]|uniref:hypothetical protein n=1 Tax=Acytostelium subglobosum LB1 TaxID=1410327 RepID=UPI0006450B84|nr:hypothetical protein SAMD00019534_027610 [Acytostelium subglobosum LB1]GAM19586.1 hypothetical protein SAMD00019534_027610 [Acytostelium subglobosum LB1]|eukprot:XP_012756348.1 hypothetical protein SAMD00019534_027610 [Acytostelium subglobosum LB1]